VALQTNALSKSESRTSSNTGSGPHLVGRAGDIESTTLTMTNATPRPPAPDATTSRVEPSTLIRSADELSRSPQKIVTRHVNFYYGDHQALFDISLNIPEHCVTALIGPSSCWKCTCLRCLNRMNDMIESTRVEGDVRLDDVDVYAPQMDVVSLRKRVGMVFQKSNPFPKSVYDNIAYGPRVAGIRKRAVLDQIVEKCLKQAALWDEVSDRLADSALQLSGGQQQRLCIARALATGPDVLLMDEPASALDPKSTARIEDLIFELKDTYTIVIVTHNMQQAARVSDQTAFFYEGRLIEVDSTTDLFTRPKQRQTEEYITGRFG